MLPDYYQVLEIASSAAPGEVKEAFRYQATRHHPDRGGSHERMVAINEAWAILSNPAKRAEYDASRQAAAPPASIVVAEQNTYQAREEAQHYPEQWAEFETWMDSLIRDFPKGEGGQSFGWFARVGVVVGLFFGLSGAIFFGMKWVWVYLLAIVCGALGEGVHHIVRFSTRHSLPPSSPKTTDRKTPPPPPSSHPDLASRIVTCPACDQKIRIRLPHPEGRVICRKCDCRFPA